MSNHDQQIIDLHPDASPYELFNDFGISNKGYKELQGRNAKSGAETKGSPVITKTELAPQIESAPPSNLLIPERVVINNRNTIQPQLSQFKPSAGVGGNVIVVTRGTGKESSMTEFAAARLIKRHPATYSIK